ncbi:MAG: hypothetical protein OXC30_02920 [Alphaproteobacteria bacterium]|nr:hypothetical protein [Alphaproteobacteria bacterium]
MLVLFYLVSALSSVSAASIGALRTLWQQAFKYEYRLYSPDVKGIGLGAMGVFLIGVHPRSVTKTLSVEAVYNAVSEESDPEGAAVISTFYGGEDISNAKQLFNADRLRDVKFVFHEPTVKARILAWSAESKHLIYVGFQKYNAQNLQKSVWNQMILYRLRKAGPLFSDSDALIKRLASFREDPERERLLHGAYLLYALLPRDVANFGFERVHSLEDASDFWMKVDMNDSDFHKVLQMSNIKRNEIREAFMLLQNAQSSSRHRSAMLQSHNKQSLDRA